MTKAQIKEILDRVLEWPPERQADLAEVARMMEQQDRSTLRLTEDQATEVQHRLVDTAAPTVTLAEFNNRLHQRYGV